MNWFYRRDGAQQETVSEVVSSFFCVFSDCAADNGKIEIEEKCTVLGTACAQRDPLKAFLLLAT